MKDLNESMAYYFSIIVCYSGEEPTFLESALKPYIILLVLWFPNGRIWLISGHLSGLFVVFLSYHPVPTPLKPLILLTFSAE